MGCTSSAPNMAPSQTNSESYDKLSDEKDKESVKKANEVILEKDNETNSIKVLPTCDNFAETTQLARNNKSFVDTTNLVIDKDYHGNGHVMESDDMIISNVSGKSESSETEEKLSKLEEVVEKVVEMYTIDKENVSEHSKTELNDVVVENKTDDNKIENETQKTPAKQDETKHSDEKDEFEETVSPSQSQSSRATRWEALADIAAELPPSLAVDPITGQIYALSK